MTARRRIAIGRTLCVGTGAKPNEDAFGFNGDPRKIVAWVIDGATTLARKRYLKGAASDAAWLSSHLSEQLHELSAADDTLVALIDRAIDNVRNRYFASLPHGEIPPVWAWPLCAMIAVKLERGQDGQIGIETVRYGDCAAFGITDRGWVTLGRQRGRTVSEKRLAASTPDKASKKPSDKSMRQYREDLLRERRTEQNSATRSRVITLNQNATLVPATGSRRICSPGRVFLVSDGITRLVDPLKMVSCGQLVRKLRDQSWSDLVRQLRSAEKEFARCGLETPYNKHDDVTLVELLF